MTLGAALGGVAFDHTGSVGVIVGSGTALLGGSVLIWKGLTQRGSSPMSPKVNP